MNEESKCQTELVLKKINKIKAFKEKVLRIKEEEFKGSVDKVNNIKIVKDKDKNEKSKSHKHKSEKRKKKSLKIKTKNNLSLSIENSKMPEHQKKQSKELENKEKNQKQLKPIVLKDNNNEERIGRFLSKNDISNNKNIKTNRTVQIKPVNKIQIDSSLSIKDLSDKKNNIITNIKITKKDDKNKSNEKEKSKSKEKEKEKEKEKPKEKEKEKSKEKEKEKEEIIEKKLLKSSSNNISRSFKNTLNKIIIKEEPKKEEEKNNINNNSSNNNININKNKINILDIININKKTKSNSESPENRGKTNKNNMSNNNKNKPKKKEKKEYKLQYCVYPGNNYKLIDKAMEHRNKEWEKVPTTYSDFCDLVWAPLSYNINFQNCELRHQYVNHIEFNIEISNKMRLYANLLRHCEVKKIDIFSIFPFTISLQISHRSFNEQLYNFEKLYKNINNYTPKGNKKFSDMFNVILSKKIGSIQNINIPETFNSGKNLWIIKPVNLNRGRFITVEKNLNEIIKKLEEIQSAKKININEKKKGNDIKCEYLLIQKYLEKPLLYQGRKFDIRIWVLFISEKEDDIYIFKQGHLKATCTKYDPDSKDLFVHLTNYSIQKYNENFSKIEIGNEIPFKAFQEELDKNNTGKNFYKDIYPKIVRIIRITGGAAKGRINFLNKKYCFEIFGYDFILDEKYQPYLLEINTNPGLEISSPLIDELLPRMIDDAFKLTIDQEFTKSYKYANKESTFPVSGYDNNENMWEKFSII